MQDPLGRRTTLLYAQITADKTQRLQALVPALGGRVSFFYDSITLRQMNLSR